MDGLINYYGAFFLYIIIYRALSTNALGHKKGWQGKPFFFTSKFSYCFFINSPVSLSLTYPFLYETPAFLNKRKIPKNATKLNDGFSGHAIENKGLFKVEFLSTTIILILILNDYEQEVYYAGSELII